MPRFPSVAAAIAFLTLASSLPECAVGQSVTGRVLESGTDVPVEAVLVELLRADSSRVRATLTGSGGRYALSLEGPGTYGIRLDRLGYRSTFLGPFVLSGDTVLDLRVAPQPVSIAPIEATGEGRCSVRPEEGVATARLWEQIRKVLAVTDVVGREGLLEFELLRFDRELDLDRSHQRIERLEVWHGSDPFQGYPPEELAANGFIQPGDNNDIYWFMPDADVILSSAFLDTHCFSVVDRFDNGRRLLGLAFEPLDADREEPDRDVRNPDFDELVRSDPADVRGVLWVDAASGALETLEYGYTGIRNDDIGSIAGGYARFEQLADGKWVIRQWWIRMPRFIVRTPRRSRRLEAVGVRENGGELVQARDSDGRIVTRRAGQIVTGFVSPTDLGVPFDSTTAVRFSGTAYLTTLSSDGSFRFPDVTPGRYLATVYHPRLDTLGIDLPVSGVTVGREPVTLDLSLPSRRDAIRSICPRMDPRSSRGILVVSVADGTNQPRSDQVVQLFSVRDRRIVREAITAGDGLARFCDVRENDAFTLLLPGFDDIRVPASVAPGGFARRDIVLDRGSNFKLH